MSAPSLKKYFADRTTQATFKAMRTKEYRECLREAKLEEGDPEAAGASGAGSNGAEANYSRLDYPTQQRS